MNSIKKARTILETIIKSQSHTGLGLYDLKEIMTAIKDNLDETDFTLDFDGNEYRLINEDAIWDIYKDEIKNIVEDCYDLKLDQIPAFIAFGIDWEQTAENAFIDGYGHTFSSYDGSEENAGGFYIFRTN